MATQLAVFDFDCTVIDGDSDAAIIALLEERTPPPDWEGGSTDWTPYMNHIFELAHSAGFSKEDILTRIGSLRGVPGVNELVNGLAERGWDIVLLTDSNSVFVHHWLKVSELEDKITCVLTNPATWHQSGRLTVSPHMYQSVCSCPSNLCKRLALSAFRQGRPEYDRVMYVGDGRNDVCPIYSLRCTDLACPREDYPCHKRLVSTPCRARVLPWRDHYDIMRELFPERGPTIRC